MNAQDPEREARQERFEEREEFRRRWNRPGRGFFCMVGLHALVGLSAAALIAVPSDEVQMIPALLLMTYPLIHLAWSLPLIFWAGSRGLDRFRSGAMLAAGIATLGGGLCFGLLCFSM